MEDIGHKFDKELFDRIIDRFYEVNIGDPVIKGFLKGRIWILLRE